MNILLITREEIICLIILLFLLLYGQQCRLANNNKVFSRICWYAIGHVFFDLITVWTVNNLDVIPKVLNDAAHILFISFAVFYLFELLCYTLTLIGEENKVTKIRRAGPYLAIAFLTIMVILPIDYMIGSTTNFSWGPKAFFGYFIAFVLILFNLYCFVKNYHNLEKHIRVSLIPMFVVMVFLECLQIKYQEILFTGAGITLVTVGIFFSLENPIEVFKRKAYIDTMTGFKSRSSYEEDVAKMQRHFEQGKVNGHYIAFVFCDINNLKQVNDNFGHLVGDEYVSKVTEILFQNVKSAHEFYRMGGDEFLIIYYNEDEKKLDDILQNEIKTVKKACEEMSGEVEYKMGVAIGYAIAGKKHKHLNEVLHLADHNMYRDKWKMKHQDEDYVPKDDLVLNTADLDSRVFEAFASSSDTTYIYLCNLKTNVSRWSSRAVQYFDLPGEYMLDAGTIWEEYIHPDDRMVYRKDIERVFSGQKRVHDVDYRARNRFGEYVLCTCNGKILKGENGLPDLFAGTLTNHGLYSGVDSITGLSNSDEFVKKIRRLMPKDLPVGILIVGIETFSYINVAYGYTNGNEILKSFANELKKLVSPIGRVYRFDGSQFAICINGCKERELIEIYEKAKEIARSKVLLFGEIVPLNLAAGALVLEDCSLGERYIKNSLVYMLSLSKHERRGELVLFRDILFKDEKFTPALIAKIHQSIIRGCQGFYLEYQPIIGAGSGEIESVEALLRWNDQEYGNLLPYNFISWLETDPCYYELGLWILRKAMRDMKEIVIENPSFILNINVTIFQLECENFVTDVLEILKEENYPPQNLCLEFTERNRALSIDFVKNAVLQFHSHGIKVALDDLGTGYSSMMLFLELPFDEIKIDRSFSLGITLKPEKRALIEGIVNAANQLGYAVCVEGIDSQETLELLKQYDITYFQGFLFSRAVPVEEIKKKIKETKNRQDHSS